MRVYLLAAIALLLCPVCAGAATYRYAYSDNCARAYECYLSLRTDEGRAAIVSEIRADPYNLMAVYIADYEDCLALLLNSDRNGYDQLHGHMDERLDLLDKGDRTSPWHRFCKAGVYLHWALIQMRYGMQYKAAANFHRSFALLKENREWFPAFEYNAPFFGLEEAVVGSLPGSYKWLASVFGMKGSVKKGTDQLAAFVATHTAHDPVFAEAELYYLYTRSYLLTEQKEVWDYLNSSKFPTKDNLLHAFVKANIALDNRRCDAAIETLRAAATSPGYSRYPVLDHQMGVALLTRQDTTCNRYFRHYLAANKSDMYIKDCWQKMALAAYIAGDMKLAAYCREQVKLNGTDRLDADKQAEKWAGTNTWPMRQLLQARLYTDGGYYPQARAILAAVDVRTISDPADVNEYYYRNGRVWEELEQNAKAMYNYQQAISGGRSRHEQFGARAALQMGKMYERMGMKEEARKRYNECLDMPAHDFQNSIDQQAKAGLNRLQ